MPITRIHSFLVKPSKNIAIQSTKGGTSVPLEGKVFDLLAGLYDKAETDCKIDIVFRPNEAGEQVNATRTMLMRYAESRSIATARLIAARLAAVTTRRSGFGLLFVVAGDHLKKRLMLSRFPADEGMIVEEKADEDMDVRFIERVFMKNAHAYKSVVYEGPLEEHAFWSGKAVDKQVDVKELSDYWIGDFLESKLKTTPSAGTKRFAVAFRDAIRGAADLPLKQDLLSAAQLVRGQDGHTISPQNVVQGMGLSGEAVNALTQAMRREEVMKETFQFDKAVFDQHVAYRSVELSNGAMLTADNADFDTIFRQRQVDDQTAPQVEGETPSSPLTEFTTVGRIVNQRLKSSLR
ncbi:MAG: hypothetical protein JO036_00860 [Candidatus Eremiobacteraeota bacterium]|nr:hypothetical protein [Candidatus Eremiobacteraeota bacterium]